MASIWTVSTKMSASVSDGRRPHDGIAHARDPRHLPHIVNANDVAASGDPDRHRCSRPLDPLVRREIERIADERLARGTIEQGKAERLEITEMIDELEALLDGLPETNSGIEDDLIIGDAGGARTGHEFHELARHIHQE